MSTSGVKALDGLASAEGFDHGTQVSGRGTVKTRGMRRSETSKVYGPSPRRTVWERKASNSTMTTKTAI